MRVTLVVGLAIVVFSLSLQAQQIHRNQFESRHISWVKGPSDAAFKELAHEMTTATAHNGQQSELIRISSEQGSYAHYLYPIGKADITEELIISVWVKANRPGIQLLARVVLPRERDPQNLDQPLTATLRGDAYAITGRWDRLSLRKPHKLVQELQPLLRADLKRDVNFEGAYIDQLMLNVLGGRGLTELWVDDLEVGPVHADVPDRNRLVDPPNPAPGKERDKGTVATPVNRNPNRHLIIELNRDRLLVNKKPYLVRGVRYSDTPMEALRNVGFNTLWIDMNTPPEAMEQAIKLGFYLVPELPVLEDNPRVSTPAALSREVARFPHSDAVLFWHVGSGFTSEQAPAVARGTQTIRAADPLQGRPISGDIWDGFGAYSRHLEMLGVHRWPLLTGLELKNYRDWLVQRGRLADGGIHLWTWVQTHLPEWYTELVYGQSSANGFTEPIGPQPEQIRLMTYIALSAGYRGLGFWSDRFLANTHQGRDRLLMMALLNQELEMLEPMLASAGDISWLNTRHPEIRAAVLRYDGGVLVLPIWIGPGSQFVPGQMATNNLEIIVPGAPQEAQVWEVTPGDVQSLAAQRVAGGLKVTVPEFGLTTAILLTADVNATDGGTIGRLQQAARRSSKLAAQWSYDLGVEELKKVEQINLQLEQSGQALPNAPRLLEECRRRLKLARDAWTHGSPTDYRTSYLEAQRALRPLRVLMRAHWERAVRELDSPVSSPYAVSFYTLPRHWRFMSEVKSAQAATNVLPTGGFENVTEQPNETWSVQEVKLDDVDCEVGRVSTQSKEGRQCLKLEVLPRDPHIAPAALERTYLAVHSPRRAVQPGALVRISGWIRIPKPIEASVDGVLFFDSVGGEPLAVRLTGSTEWRRFTLYRQAPTSGEVGVTVALTGIGAAYFDDIRIEPLYLAPTPGSGS
jgi:hypothetical protein